MPMEANDGSLIGTPEAVPGTGAWTRIAVFQIDSKSQQRGRTVVTGLVGANAITGLKVTRATQRGGIHVDVAVDSDLAASNVEVQSCFPALAYLTGAGGSFQIALNNSGAAEWAVWAKAATATTVQCTAVVS